MSNNSIINLITNQAHLINDLLFAVIILLVMLILLLIIFFIFLRRNLLAIQANREIVQMFCQLLDQYLPEKHKLNIKKKEGEKK